jgi:conjugative transfer signal peptidase TraF
MNRRLKYFTNVIAIGGAAILVIGLILHAAGARVNTSKSIPLGLYWVSAAPVAKNTYVMFCPPQIGVFAEARKRQYIQAGFCPGGYGYMMKKVLGTTNDAVDVAGEGVRVNGVLLPLSALLKADRAGRPMPRFQADHYVLGNSELLLMTDVSATSFDGRYFGPVNRSQIVSVVTPVLTW